MELANYIGFFIWAFMSIFWLISIPLQNVAIIDYAWGLSFVGVSLIAFKLGSTEHIPLVIAVSIWGLRLFIHLLMRKTHLHEDKRYLAIRQHYGVKNFWWQSYAIIFKMFFDQAGIG